jgi:hypothetical protein
MALIKATYVTDWDNGTETRLSCYFDPFRLNVSDIQPADPVDACTEREYIELPTGEIVDTFNEGDRVIADGVQQDESSEMNALDIALGKETHNT